MERRLPTRAITAGMLLLLVACETGVLEPRPAAPEQAAPARAGLGPGFGDWMPAVNLQDLPGTDPELNTPSLDGCPFISRDGKSLYLASARPGGLGGIDIWVSTRSSDDAAWGAPVNVGAPINSSADDFCPTLDRDGHRFFFVSRRVTAESCGGADIYMSRFRDDGWIDEPVNLGCDVNSAFDEASPFPIPESGAGPVLYFSSTRPGLGVGGDLYRSESHGGEFGPAGLVPGVNSPFDDGQPNLRRDGLELYFYSTRPDPAALGGPDLYSATRASTSDAWSAPVNLGPAVNSAAGETRPSLSWDGTQLYFGSNRPGSEGGSADIYLTTRSRLDGGGD